VRTIDCPIYDVHMHVDVAIENLESVIRCLDACGIAKAVVMNRGYGKDRPNTEYQASERIGFELLEKYPDRIAVFSTVDFSAMDEPGFTDHAVMHFEETIKRGASGLKLWLGKPDHHWMALDDPRVGALYEKAAELGVPVTIHIGDPEDYWKPSVSPDSFWYGVLKENPHWLYWGKDIPSREVLFEEQRRMLEKYPSTTFICPHMGGHAENLDYLGELLDEYPNLYVDTTAYEPVMGQEPDSARTFLIKYQDRIMFGTDNGWTSRHDLKMLTKRMRARRLFYETDIEQTNLDDFWPRRPGYTIRGVKLPGEVIRKIYYQNAAHLIPALADD